MSIMKLLSPLESLPNPLLDRITSETIVLCPPLTLAFLSELGSNIHQSALRTIFSTLILQDDARFINVPRKEFRSPVLSVLLNPMKYGSLVRNVEIVDPVKFEPCRPPVDLFEMETGDQTPPLPSSELWPISAADLERILQRLPHLEGFAWRSTTCPPDGICETLARCNPRLSSFAYLPVASLLLSLKAGPMRWDGLSLPLLSNLSLTTLQLSRLSHVGAKSLSNLLSLLEEDSLLENVSIDTNWLDEQICQLLGNVSRKAKRLQFASDGTRLTDGCITTLISLCESLEEFSLGDIQGRLSKSIWEKIDDFPPSMRRFRIGISEATLQHSWAIDHLASLQSLPLSILTHLSITRVSNPFQAQIHEVASLKPVPEEFVRSLRAAKSLRYLTCDWWSWTAEALKTPMESCTSLRSFRIAFDGSFSKLLSTCLPMSSAVSLESFAAFISPEHYPTLPPSPATTHRAVSRSPSASPLQVNRRLSTSVSSSSDPISEEKVGSTRASATVSETGIHLREIRKFVRRSPTLREIIWYGRSGIQGQWTVTRSAVAAQSSANLTVEYTPCAALSEAICNKFCQEEEAVKAGWSPGNIEREGAVWTGPNADLYNALRTAEKDNEERQAKEEKATRLASRKGASSGLALEMPRPSLKSSISASTIGQENQIPSPISPVEPKHAVSPKKPLTRERPHASASAGGRSNGDTSNPSSNSSQQARSKTHSDLGMGSSKAPGGHESGRSRTSGRRSTHAGSEGRPRADSSAGGSRRPFQAAESTPTSRGGSSRGGKTVRGGRGSGRPRRTEA